MLPGVVAKIDRSRELADSLHADCASWASEHPPVVRVEIDGADGFLTWFADPSAEPPLDLSVRAGEIVQHLRSCLDHTIWGVVESAGNTPNRSTRFPILDDPKKKFSSVAAHALRGVPGEARAIVERVQPESPRGGEPWLLWILSMSNLDKHRALYASHAAMAARKARTYVPFGVPYESARMATNDDFTSPSDRRWIMKIPLPNKVDISWIEDETEIEWHHDVRFWGEYENLQMSAASLANRQMISATERICSKFDPFL